MSSNGKNHDSEIHRLTMLVEKKKLEKAEQEKKQRNLEESSQFEATIQKLLAHPKINRKLTPETRKLGVALHTFFGSGRDAYYQHTNSHNDPYVTLDLAQETTLQLFFKRFDQGKI